MKQSFDFSLVLFSFRAKIPQNPICRAVFRNCANLTNQLSSILIGSIVIAISWLQTLKMYLQMQYIIHLFLLVKHLFHSLVRDPLFIKIIYYFLDEQMDGNTQLFVPFCCEVSLSEVDNFDNSDSDCEPDRHGSKTLSPTSR